MAKHLLQLVEDQGPANDRPISEVQALTLELAESRREAQHWQDEWIALVGQVGDLLHKAKARPQGKRFARVLELMNILSAAEPTGTR